MLWSLFLRIIAGILGLFLATEYVPGVSFFGKFFVLPTNEEQVHAFIDTLTFAGIFLGILNSVAKPILDKITLPLRIITLNLFSLVIAMAMVWITKTVFPKLQIDGFFPLFWTTVIVWLLGFILLKWLPSEKK